MDSENNLNLDNIMINTVTVYYLEKTLTNGRDKFSSLDTAVSSVSVDGASSKIVALYNEVKASVPGLCVGYHGMSDTVTRVKNKIEEVFPEDAELFGCLDGCDDEFLDQLLDEAEKLCDVDNLLPYFDKNSEKYNSLDKLSESENVADYYNGTVLPDGTVVDGYTYVNLLQAAILNNYSGRDAATMSMLLPIGLAANKGFVIPYEHHGTDVYDSNDGNTRYRATLDVMLGGVDCNSAVSHGVAQGAKGDFAWWTVAGFGDWKYKNNNESDYSLVQPGDVLHKTGHVVMVIGNDPVTEELIVAESTPAYGYIVRKFPYSEVYGNGYTSYDMSRVYEE